MGGRPVRSHLAGGVVGLLAVMAFGGSAFAAMPIGYLDEAQPTWVGGWAFDPDHKDAEIAIHTPDDGGQPEVV